MKDEDNILKHLEKLVGIQPVSTDQALVEHALLYCEAVLRAVKKFKKIKMHERRGVFSLTASTQNTKQPKLLLQAHIDVVSAPETLKYATTKEFVYGRGVYDMLFAVACYLAFIEKHANLLPGLDLGIMLTGDEELGGFDGTEYLLTQDYGAEVCFLPDAGEGYGDMNIAAKGAHNFTLVMNGKAHHGSRPWEGSGAGNKLIAMLSELFQVFDAPDQANSTLTVTKLSGGDTNNKGPSNAAAHLDIRYKDRADLKRIKAFIEELCYRYDAHIESLITISDYALDLSNHHIKTFIDLYQKHTGYKITFSKSPGSSDARYFINKNIPVIMIRPEGVGAHSDHEALSRQGLLDFYKLFEEFALETAKINSI